MITITREKKIKRQGWDWTYSFVGPDGYHSSNKSADLLRQVAEKRYPEVLIVEEWDQEPDPPAAAPRIDKLIAVADAALAYIDAGAGRQSAQATKLLALDEALDELEGETT